MKNYISCIHMYTSWFSFVTLPLRCFSCGKKCSNSVALVIDLFGRSVSLSLSLQINDYNDKPDMIRKLKRQPWPWPLSISVTYTCGIRSRAANGLKDPLMEKKRNLIELGTSIQFAWESDNISKHHKTKHCDWMSWDATEMKRHDKASTHRPSSPLRQLLFHAFGCNLSITSV